MGVCTQQALRIGGVVRVADVPALCDAIAAVGVGDAASVRAYLLEDAPYAPDGLDWDGRGPLVCGRDAPPHRAAMVGLCVLCRHLGLAYDRHMVTRFGWESAPGVELWRPGMSEGAYFPVEHRGGRVAVVAEDVAGIVEPLRRAMDGGDVGTAVRDFLAAWDRLSGKDAGELPPFEILLVDGTATDGGPSEEDDGPVPGSVRGDVPQP